MRFFFLLLCYAALSGCVRSDVSALPPPQNASTDASNTARTERGRDPYRTLYAFKGIPDGATPNFLLDVNGMLFGTTYAGGLDLSAKKSGKPDGSGTVFSISPSGSERVIYRFKGRPDGAGPNSLVDVSGTLYGTTTFGGSSTNCDGGCGTVFAITPDGKETVLHSFAGSPDGATPMSPLIDVNGTLYGTTAGGGGSGPRGANGTVFTITFAGDESVLHRFLGTPDGVGPSGTLALVNDTLYGTTVEGGAHGLGSVFRLTSTGDESVLYSFTNRPDGHTPLAGVVAVDGVLYGETEEGGTCTGFSNDACGTVFGVTMSGEEHIVHSFQGPPSDGYSPGGGLTVVDGVLYGTTANGGSACRKQDDDGCGTLFRVTTAGREAILHNFNGRRGERDESSGGYGPYNLLSVGTTLYGTAFGPGYFCGKCRKDGLVFAQSL